MKEPKCFSRRYQKLAGLVVIAALSSQANAAVTYSYTGGLPQGIPDNLFAGVDLDINVLGSGTFTGLYVTVGLSHGWASDLVMTMNHGATTVDLFRLPGGSSNGNDFSGTYRFIDTASISVGQLSPITGVIPQGDYRAATAGETLVSLDSSFAGQDINGLWRFNVSDRSSIITGSVTSLSITFVPEPSSLALVGAGAISLAWRRNRRKA